MMLTDFIIKTPDGDKSPVVDEKNFRRISNILADKPEPVAEFFVLSILKNTKNNAHIVWLTKFKAMMRFIMTVFKKRSLI
jgi:hypothetical protein